MASNHKIGSPLTALTPAVWLSRRFILPVRLAREMTCRSQNIQSVTGRCLLGRSRLNTTQPPSYMWKYFLSAQETKPQGNEPPSENLLPKKASSILTGWPQLWPPWSSIQRHVVSPQRTRLPTTPLVSDWDALWLFYGRTGVAGTLGISGLC